MKPPLIDPEETIISFNDVKQLYISMWKKLLKWAFLGVMISFFFFSGFLVKYKAQASFKEGIEKSSSTSVLKEFMGGIMAGAASQPQAASTMKSNQVLRPVVEELGLQIHFCHSEWFIRKYLSRLIDNYKAERGIQLKDLDSFAFERVKYEKEKAFSFNLLFTDETHFVVFGESKKEELGKGVVGEECAVDEGRFTLIKTPEKLKINKFYPFVMNPWVAEVGNLQSKIKIEKDKDNPSLIMITASHPDRFLAAKIANGVMIQYQLYLKRGYDEIADQQLAYLESKQEQILAKMDELFKQQSLYCGQNLVENGFLGLEQESQSLLVPHQQMYNKVLLIDTELARLDEIEKKGEALIVAEEGPFSSKMNQISQMMHDLKQQRDLLELSLSSGIEETFANRRDGLKEVRAQRYEIEKLKQEVNLGEEISSCDLNTALSLWAKGLESPQEREDFASYLGNYARLLSMQEKILQERIFYAHAIPKELEGIDLSSAKNLFVQYNHKLDQTEGSRRHYAELKKEIPNSDFDLAPLSSVLHDALSQKLIAEASELNLKLKDEKHHSSKEAKRWEDEISLYRKILIGHLDQLDLVEELNADLIRQKMAALQEISLDCINRQISVLNEQSCDCIKERREALLLEKKLLEEKMGELRAKLAKILPEKWRFEKWLNIKTNMATKIMETVTEVSESRSIAHQTHHVESKPLDMAIVPSAPKSPRLFLMCYLGAFAMPFSIFSFACIRKAIKGFPISLEKLKMLKFPTLGSISSFCDGPSVEGPSGPDLDILRKVALFSDGAKVIALLANQGCDYSFALGENLGRQNKKSIILRCDFLSKFRKEDVPGILQIWQGKIGELPIRKGRGFDYLSAGGFTPFGTEIIQSDQFYKLLEILKKNYDQIYLLFRSPLNSAESQAALKICERAVVTISNEQIEELTPFSSWGYDEKECRITFITIS